MNPLLDELRAAFPLVSLTAARAFHMYSDAAFCERAVDGRCWDELDPRLLASRSDALAFLAVDRFIAWLPAYLNLVVLTEPSHCAAWGTLMMRLTAPPVTASPRKKRRFEEDLGDRLTPAQRHVVARSLQLTIERFPAWGDRPRRALDYWRAFASATIVTPDPLLAELRLAFPPVVIANVFVEDDWRYCELYPYRREVEGKTWEQVDPLFLVHHGEALAQVGPAAVCAVLPMHLHLLVVYAPTAATDYVLAALDRDDLVLSDAQRAVIARYRAAIS